MAHRSNHYTQNLLSNFRQNEVPQKLDDETFVKKITHAPSKQRGMYI